MPSKPFNDRDKFINKSLDDLTGDLEDLQSDLMDYIQSDYITKFATAKGLLEFNRANLRLLQNVDLIVKELQKLQSPIDKNLVNDLLKLTEFSKDYFSELTGKLPNISKQLNSLYQAIGITQEGAIIKDGFLSRTISSIDTAFRQDVANYVLNSVASNKPYYDFTKGFKELIEGGKDLDGKLLRYYKQYVYDLESKMARITDNYYADELGLEWFTYAGGLIDTSRTFCENKNGQLFTKEMALKLWPDDPNLIDQKHLDMYSPLIDMGRYNCRHIPAWTTNEAAMQIIEDEGQAVIGDKEFPEKYLEMARDLIEI